MKEAEKTANKLLTFKLLRSTFYNQQPANKAASNLSFFVSTINIIASFVVASSGGLYLKT